MQDEPQLIHYLFLIGLGIALMISGGWTLWRHPPQARQQVPWKGRTLLAVVLGYLMLQVLAVQLFIGGYGAVTGEEFSHEELRQVFHSGDEVAGPEFAQTLRMTSYLLLAGNVGSITFLVLGVAWLWAVSKASARDLGWNWKEIGTDIRLGIAGFLLAAPAILFVQATLRSLQKESVREHVIERMMRGADALPQSDLVWTMLILVLSASVVAPLVEEFLFRVVLQGWFEARLPRLFEPRAAATGMPAPAPRSESDETAHGARESVDAAGNVEVAGDEAAGTGLLDPYSSPAAGAAEPDVAPREEPVTPNWNPGWLLAIFLSSVLFALAHFTQWPDPVPLFLFALMLGYLYQSTHRILPSLVAHFCLNTFSLSMMWLAFVARPGQ